MFKVNTCIFGEQNWWWCHVKISLMCSSYLPRFADLLGNVPSRKEPTPLLWERSPLNTKFSSSPDQDSKLTLTKFHYRCGRNSPLRRYGHWSSLTASRPTTSWSSSLRSIGLLSCFHSNPRAAFTRQIFFWTVCALLRQIKGIKSTFYKSEVCPRKEIPWRRWAPDSAAWSGIFRRWNSGTGGKTIFRLLVTICLYSKKLLLYYLNIFSFKKY